MRLISYDCEVFAYDWLVTLKDKETGVYTCIWNDNEALKMALSDDCIYVGFNSKHYDQYIIKAIAAGLSPEEIKRVNDFIIAGGQGWQCPLLDGIYFRFSNVDIRDDTQQGLSLKAIEGHLGMSVKESSVPFDIDRPLTPEEKAETEFYCKHDVDTAERLIDIRKDYLKNKINLGRLAGLDEVKAMGMTNAKLTAAMLKATKKPHDDERKYVYPDNLRKEYIPPEVFAFFDRMYDLSISDSELFKGKFNLNIGECPVTLGYGGIHGAIPNFFWEETEDIVMYNIPMRTGCAIEPETVSRLAKDFSNIRGVKDSSGKFENILAYIHGTDPEHFSVLSGNDALILKTLQNGGKGGITAVANILPEMMVSIYQNWKKGDMVAAEAAQQGIQPIRDCFKYGNPNSIVKRAANLIGQPLGPCRKPFGMVSEETDRVILDTIDRYYSVYKR